MTEWVLGEAILVNLGEDAGHILNVVITQIDDPSI